MESSIGERYGEKGRPLVIAHRGYAPDDIRRNSLQAFELAAEMGADGIELDLRTTADGKVIVHHDPIHANIKGIRRVSTSTLEELIEITRGPGRIPTFEEVYKISRDMLIFCEIKGAPNVAPIIQHILDVVPESQKHRIIIMGYFNRVVKMENHPELPWGKHYFTSTPFNLYEIEQYTKNADNLSVISPYYGTLSDRHLQKLNRYGRPIIPFTVNRRRVLWRLSEKPIHGIYTDNLPLAMSIMN
ncbi:MAG: glycerophosphodiester phosphodiesterase [Candidatus Kariarchaeaceae archaeon]